MYVAVVELLCRASVAICVAFIDVDTFEAIAFVSDGTDTVVAAVEVFVEFTFVTF